MWAMLREVPLEDTADPDRSEAVRNIRKRIARRWQQLSPDAFKGSSQELEKARKGYEEQLDQLAEMYAPETRFAPRPQLPALEDSSSILARWQLSLTL